MTNSTSLSLPESFHFWMKQPQNVTALTRLERQKTPPPSLTWEELQDFYHAKFSYQLIIYEYYLFLQKVWEHTWGEALRQKNEFIPFKAGEYADKKIGLSPAEVWVGRLVRVFHKENESWWFGVSIDAEHEALRLYWYHGNDDEDLSTGIGLKGWEDEPDEEEYRITKKELCLLTTHAPLEGLRRIAALVFEAIQVT